MPSHKVGILSLLVLTLTLLARYRFHLSGGWRKTYVITAVLALYLNVFVLVVQLFLKVPVPPRARPHRKPRSPLRGRAGRRPGDLHRPRHRRHPPVQAFPALTFFRGTTVGGAARGI